MLLSSLCLFAVATLTEPEPESAPEDPSTAPDLDVPALETKVLSEKKDKNLDSLNPPPPPEPPEPTAQEAPQDSGKDEDQTEAKATPAPQGDQESIHFQDRKESASTIQWANTPPEGDALKFSQDRKAPESYTYAPDGANAPVKDESGSRWMRKPHVGFQSSPQRFALHFKTGPYLPQVDRGNAQGPYAKLFGEVDAANQVVKQPSNRLIYWLGFDWQFWNLGGPLSVGVDLGFFTDSAPARIAANVLETSSADQNRFSVIPVALLAGYRFSYLADHSPVPLVPYLRAGLSYNFWWTRKGPGEPVRTPEGESVRGGVLGWQGQVGLAIRLDGIFRRAGRAMDHRFGINHVSIFGELATAKSGLGGDKVNVGDNTFYGGLLLEF